MPDVFVAKPHSPKKTAYTPDPLTPGTVSIKKKEHHPFTAFHLRPEGISFQNQEKNETIYLFMRRHFFTNMDWILATVCFTFLPLLFPLMQTLFDLTLFEIPTPYLIILLAFYYLILFGFAFVSYVTWFYNVGIITNLRVVDVDITSLQSKNVAATSLSDIVDVSYSQHGLLSNILNYGDVHMQTEGLKPNFEYLSIPQPAKAADIISDMMAGREVEHD